MKYLYIAPKLWMNESGYGTYYESDLKMFSKKEGALRHGFKETGSDDFWVCEFDGKKVVKIFHSDLELRDFEDVKEDIDGINLEFAFED